MSSNSYDLIIIGAGPGGYIAAERAGALGKRVLLIEKEYLGGVCLNWGCIPSKALLHSAKLYEHTHNASQFGVDIQGAVYNLEKAMSWKTNVIDTLRKGIAYKMKSHKVEVLNGTATLTGPRSVEVNGDSYTSDYIILATGSSPVVPPIPGADQSHVMTSNEVLSIDTLPSSIAIIGGGVIGMEFASFFSMVGVKVSVIEMLPDILPFLDGDITKLMKRSMKGVDFKLGCKVERIESDSVVYSRDGAEESVEADAVLLAIGRKPNIDGLGLEAAGVEFDRFGVKVSDTLRTNIPSIYAIGDLNGKSQLAHSASRMGEVAVKTMFGGTDRMRYHAIPLAIFSNPEIAGCGLTEAQAKEQGIDVDVAMMTMKASGRFLVEHGADENGSVKVIVDRSSRVLLGVYMIGGMCSEMIHAAATMIEAELRVQDIQEIVFPHPTVAEVMKDAFWSL
jgi:dihydrolipoamide dehydrogenase